ncbi:MAG: hypothetical protein IJU20_03565 [Clostridia bacterium]|nr:hypothetical protein [Clostridia bacterium]
MRVRTIRASEICALDSDVRTGGGTDVTKPLQAVLDIAKEEGGVHLIMDGAALVTHLDVWSNTTIECLTPDCGFYQADGSDTSILTNRPASKKGIVARNITLLGGTYNQNCAHQAHHRPFDPGRDFFEDNPSNPSFSGRRYVFGLDFYGVENLTLRGLTVRDFRTYAVMVGCFRNVTIEDVWLDLPGRMQAQNQDGFHFAGPGRYLTVRNVGGRVGDDFMNIGPDEEDLVSSITDVLVDGVFHDDADQSIRLLSRGTGRLDRVTIRNVIGTYRSFGFYINSWFPDKTCGQFGDILFENIDLRQTEPNYDYRPPMLFSVGGEIRSLIIKNVRHIDPADNRALLEIGLPFYATTPATIDDYVFPGIEPHVDYLEVDGLTLLQKGHEADGAEWISNYGTVDTFVLRNVSAVRTTPGEPDGVLLANHKRASVGTLWLDGVLCRGLAGVVTGEEKITHLLQSRVELPYGEADRTKKE